MLLCTLTATFLFRAQRRRRVLNHFNAICQGKTYTREDIVHDTDERWRARAESKFRVASKTVLPIRRRKIRRHVKLIVSIPRAYNIHSRFPFRRFRRRWSEALSNDRVQST